MSIVPLVLAAVVERPGRRVTSDDYRRLLARAEQRAVLPIVYRYLEATGRLPDASDLSERRMHVLRAALLRRSLVEVLDALRSDVDVRVLKGEPLSRLLFGDPLLRKSTDLDLLVAPADVEPTVARLAGLGYRQVGDTKPWAYDQIHLQHPERGVTVDLHWRINHPYLPTPPLGWSMAAPTTVDVDGVAVPILRPEPLLVQLCFHFHQHHGFLKGLLDVAGWIDRFEDGADVDEIRAVARGSAIGGVIDWPLRTIELLTGHRSRLLGERRLAVEVWAAHTVSKIEDGFWGVSSPGRFEGGEQSLWDKIGGVVTESATMLVADRVGIRLRAALHPLVLGPHRLGRALFPRLERVGLLEADDFLG